MWSTRVLEAYLHALEQTEQDAEWYIGELVAMIEQHKLLHGKSYKPALPSGTFPADTGSQYSLSLISQFDSELMVMSRIKPSAVIEIRSHTRLLDLALRWHITVMCIEHKVLSFLQYSSFPYLIQQVHY